jgi:streptogramin lyase
MSSDGRSQPWDPSGLELDRWRRAEALRQLAWRRTGDPTLLGEGVGLDPSPVMHPSPDPVAVRRGRIRRVAMVFVAVCVLLSGGIALYARTHSGSSGPTRVPKVSTPRLTEFPLPEAGSRPVGITLGPDGNLWFTEFDGNRIGRITPAGSVTEFPLPSSDSQPFMIAPGPDGNLWFSEYNATKIGRITPDGVITEYPLPGRHLAAAPCYARIFHTTVL